MEPVFDTMVDQVVPLSVDLCISYPVIGEPPLFDGAVQDRLICDDETVEAVSPVGAVGTVAGAVGVAFASFDCGDSPIEFTAVTL